MNKHHRIFLNTHSISRKLLACVPASALAGLVLSVGPLPIHANEGSPLPPCCAAATGAGTFKEAVQLASLEAKDRQEENNGEDSRPAEDQTKASSSKDDDEDADGDRRDRRRGRGSDRPDEMAVLERLLSMSPEQLANVRRAVEQIEAMSPKQRKALRDRLHDFREISPENRRKMREKWRGLSQEERREYIQKMRDRQWQRVFEDEAEEESDKSETRED